jgi:hypothetical protein
MTTKDDEDIKVDKTVKWQYHENEEESKCIIVYEKWLICRRWMDLNVYRWYDC